MIPVPIPDDAIPEGCKRFVVSPPDGDLTNDQIRPVEAVAGIVNGHVTMAMLVAFEPGDLDRLRKLEEDGYQPAVWLTMLTHQIPAFAVEIADGQG